MKSFYYNVDDAEFVDRSGEKLSRFVPELFYQERAEWRIYLRDGENSAVDISNVVAWGAAVDCDYRGETAPMCRTLSEDIAADAEAGSVTVKLDAATAEFFAAVNGMSGRRAYFALYGLNPDGEREFQLEFEISARMIIDPDPAVPLQVPDTLATREYVTARIGSAAALASAAAREGLSGAMMSDAEIDTTVGDYRLTYTSSGGLVVSGGWVQLRVSSGAVIAGTADADGSASIAASGGNFRCSTTRGCEVFADEYTLRLKGCDGVAISGNSVTANGEEVAGVAWANSRFAAETVLRVDEENNSAMIPVLSGGTAYIFALPLTSLSVASVASSTREAWIEFTVASGGSVSINDSNYKYLGGRPSAFEGGSSYAVGFRWGRQAVCAPLEA